MQVPTQTVIEIDDQIEALIAEINGAPSQTTIDFVQECQGVLIDSVLGPFGLSREILVDREGGNITTLRNFEKGIVANDADGEKHASWQAAQSETFDRADYSAPLQKERDAAFASTTHVEDAYTGELLANERSTHRDHVVSAHEVEKSSVGQFAQTREERVKTANLDANKQWTAGDLNASKGDRDLLAWKDARNSKDPSKTNAEYYGADQDRMTGAYEKARTAVDRAQTTDLAIKYGKEFVQEGGAEAGKVALRQIIGLMLSDIVQGVVQDVRTISRDGIRDARQLAAMLRLRAAHTKRRFEEKWTDYLQHGATAGLSGLFSSLATLLINSFVTTAKNIVTIIRECALAVAKSVKAVLLPPPGMTGGEIAQHALKLFVGVGATVVGITLEEAIRKLIEGFPLLLPVAGMLSAALTAIISGMAGLLAVLAFDKLKEVLSFQKKQIANLHRGQQVTLLRVQRSFLVIAEAHRVVRDSSEVLRTRLAEDDAKRANMRADTDESIDAFTDAVGGFDALLDKV